MIGFITGTVTRISPEGCVFLTAGGIGYEVTPTGSLLSDLKEGTNGQAHVHTHVREQEITLYGFSSLEERTLFLKLVGISGIGPKVAISILSMPMAHFLPAVENEDVTAITRIPGIGKKTAERLILELKGKLPKLSRSQGGLKSVVTPAAEEASLALQSLGYSARDIGDVLDQAPEGSGTEDLVKFFLSHI